MQKHDPQTTEQTYGIHANCGGLLRADWSNPYEYGGCTMPAFVCDKCGQEILGDAEIEDPWLKCNGAARTRRNSPTSDETTMSDDDIDDLMQWAIENDGCAVRESGPCQNPGRQGAFGGWN
jgi:hypothetical protein